MMDLLLEALLLPEPQARRVWERWRATVDIDTLSYASQQLLLALIPTFPEWLKDDPAAGIFKGVVRRVWSQNQLRLRAAVKLDSLLREAGLQPAIAGPVAWSLRTKAPAIRIIPHLTFLLPRGDIRTATEALVPAGWEPYGDWPSDRARDWSDRVYLRRQNLELHLQWRLIPTPPEDAFECEKAFLSQMDQIRWNHNILSTTSPENTLLHVLCGQRNGDLPWQADVALIGTADIEWDSFLKLTRSFGPLATERLRELHCFSRLGIPRLPSNHLGPFRRHLGRFWRAYRAHGYHRQEALSWTGLAEFLAHSLVKKCAFRENSPFRWRGEAEKPPSKQAKPTSKQAR